MEKKFFKQTTADGVERYSAVLIIPAWFLGIPYSKKLYLHGSQAGNYHLDSEKAHHTWFKTLYGATSALDKALEVWENKRLSKKVISFEEVKVEN